MDLITRNDDRRKTFFNEYKSIKEEGKVVINEAELDKLVEQISENYHPMLKGVTDIYRELVKQGNSLRDFLDAGAQEILERIEAMEEHRRALDTTRIEEQDIYSKITVFISYVQEDIEAAQKLYGELKTAGVSPWMDKLDLLPGQRWKPAINDAIKNSRYFIALFSSNSVESSGYAEKQLKTALDILDEFPSGDIFIIPARLDDCKISEGRIADLYVVDLFPDWGNGIQKILKGMGVDMSGRLRTDGLIS